MRKQTWVQTITWAAGTCALTLTLLGTSPLQAEDPQAATPVAEIDQNPLSDSTTGVIVRAVFADKDAKAEADKPLPAINLVATGREGKDVTITVHYSLVQTSIPHPMSRMMPMPQELTQGKQEVVIKAGQTTTIPLNLKAALLINHRYSLELALNAGPIGSQISANAMTFSLMDPERAKLVSDFSNSINSPVSSRGVINGPLGSKPVEGIQMANSLRNTVEVPTAGPTTSIAPMPLPPETQPTTQPTPEPTPKAPAKGQYSKGSEAADQG